MPCWPLSVCCPTTDGSEVRKSSVRSARWNATLVGVLVLYLIGAGVGVAVIQARGAASAIDRLASTARALAEGDLDARAGRVGGGPELDALARTLDEMAQRLSESIAVARDADAKRRDLITAVSHDLRTPLADLRAMVEAADDGVVEDLPSFRRYAAEMRRAVSSLVVLVDDLFELAQLDVSGIELWRSRRCVRSHDTGPRWYGCSQESAVSDFCHACALSYGPRCGGYRQRSPDQTPTQGRHRASDRPPPGAA